MSALRKYLKQPEPDRRVATVAVMHGPHLLMGMRRDNGKWTTPGGHADNGEDLHSAAVRELEEESGIVADHSQLEPLAYPKIVSNEKGETVEVQPFAHHVEARPSLTGSDDPDAEIKRWKWVDISGGLPDDIRKNLHVPFERNALCQALGLTDKEGVMENCGPLGKYMKKKGMNEKNYADQEMAEAAHEAPSDDDFETVDTMHDPLEDHEDRESKMASSSLAKYQKLKMGKIAKG